MANILIVDDHAGSRLYLDELLRVHKHNVAEASGVTQALAACRASKPDLIITDVLMPGDDGYELVRKLRMNPDLADISVIFYTASYYDEAEARALATACGVSHVISKLAGAKAILAAVDSVLGSPHPGLKNSVPEEFDREHARILNDKLYASVRKLELANASLRASEEQMHRLAESLRSALEDERARIARHLHDELGQALTMLKMSCSWVAARLQSPPEGIAERLQSSIHIADETIHTVRRLATELRPGILDLGIGAAIEWQAEEFQKHSETVCLVDLCDDDDLADSRVATELFRIFQETLTNILRHAAATRVNISLKREGSELVLEVRDNGKGITGDRIVNRTSLGLLGMRERAALIGGTFSIGNHKAGGTVVCVRAPARSSSPSASS